MLSEIHFTENLKAVRLPRMARESSESIMVMATPLYISFSLLEFPGRGFRVIEWHSTADSVFYRALPANR